MAQIVAHHYRIPLQPTLDLGGAVLSERRGVLLSRNSGDSTQWADAAPLPGFSQESVSDIVRHLRDGDGDAPPSLRFALDSLDLPEPEAHRIPVNALMMGTADTVRKQIEVVREANFVAVKLKVGRSSLQDDIDLVRFVRSRLRTDQSLRLDANRGWQLSQALEFGAAVGDLRLEYIEEPSDRPSDFDVFTSRTGIPYALDETLRDTNELSGFQCVAALIVKPTLLGGKLVLDRLGKYGLPLVFSSCFESGVGVHAIARWAATYAPLIPAGLDTYRWIAADVLRDRLAFENGGVRVDQSIQVHDSCLEEIRL